MLRRQVAVLLGFLLLAGGLVYGLMQLFSLRMAQGDVFPDYSTLRADPLGTKVLLDSLNAIPGLSVRRNFQPLPHLNPPGPITLIYAGVNFASRWEEKELRHFETLVGTGSRAVFALSPTSSITFAPTWDDTLDDQKKRAEKAESEVRKSPPKKDESPKQRDSRLKEEAKQKAEAERKAEEERERAKRRRELAARFEKQRGTTFSGVAEKWGFAVESSGGAKGTAAAFRALAQSDAYGLEPVLPWHSLLHFARVKAPWKVLYSINGRPVVIERPWGEGSIVFASDSYLLSNEALHGPDRAPRLLAQLIGTAPTIVFDEEHLGVAEQAGISTLAQKYRLHGLVAGLLLVAALFIWQNIVRFVPPRPEELETDVLVTGRGSSEGFLALLRRSVPAGELLNTCVAEWRRAFAHDTRAQDRLNAARAQPARDVVAAYDSMVRALLTKQNPVLNQPAPPSEPAKPLDTPAPELSTGH